MSSIRWSRLAQWRSAEDSLDRWRMCLDEAFEAFKPFLRRCPGVHVKGYDCPVSGARLVVRERKAGFVAFATGDDAGYVDDQYLSWDDVQAWRVDWEALAGMVQEALGLDPAGENGSLSPNGMVAVGFCRRGGDEARKRVLMCLPQNYDEAVESARGVSAIDGGGCMLIAGQFAGVRETLATRGMAEVLMGDCLRVEDGRICGDCGMACEAVAGDTAVVAFGEKLDRGIERFISVRRDDASRIQGQRETIESMAEGPDRFLAGLQGRLDLKERELFFELIDRVQDGSIQRVRSLSEIGERLGGISKQAVNKRKDRLYKKHKSVEEYVRSIREPKKELNFSELSPSRRSKMGVDKAYNYDSG